MPVQKHFCGFIALLSLGFTLAPTQNAMGDIYYYEDTGGVLRFSDEPPVDIDYLVQKDFVEKNFRASLQKYPVTELRKLILQFSGTYNLDPALVEAVVKAESEYDSMAVSRKGARGLMQLMPGTAKALGVSDLHNPEENLKGGIAHLRKLLDQFDGNVDLALAAYNAGQQAVLKHKGIPPYPETVDYVSKVRKYYSHFAQTLTVPDFAALRQQPVLAP